MIGSSVAEVEESKHPNFPVGTTIVIMAGWVERGIVDPDKMNKDSPGGTLGGVMPAPDLPGTFLQASRPNRGSWVLYYTDLERPLESERV